MFRRTRGTSSGPSRLRGRLSALIAGILLTATAAVVAPAPPAQALSGSEFIPGLIISDALFYNRSAMSEAEIQLFLASKGSALAGYTFTVNSRPAVYSNDTGNLRCNPFEGGTLSAATIIYRAQVSCGISAKVLLVTLQKEQGLITKSNPSQSALDRAMGYACPDTAPCAPSTLGFGNQVYSGALQFNTYKQSRFGRQPGVHSILFNPNSGCGSTQVNIQNYATAALYNYTPYQPNVAALANLGGTGDSCSSYGNRNFWVFYQTWFGSTLDNTPYAYVSPGIVGNPTLGTTLTINPGIWAGAPTFVYAWMRCAAPPDTFVDGVPSSCTALGVTGDSYVSTPDDVGKYIGVAVTGTNVYGSLTTGTLMSARIGTPYSLVAPTVTGTTTIGSTWTLNPGTWSGTPAPSIIQAWLRCTQPMPVVYTTVPAACTAIGGATGTSYVSTSTDLGLYLTAQVAGSNSLGFVLAGAISTLKMGFPANMVAPTVSGTPLVGSTITLDVGTWSGTPTPTYVQAWLRCSQPVTTGFTTVPAGCAAISGATAATYVPTAADAGLYLTAQVAGVNSAGFSLTGALSTPSIQAAAPANTAPPTVTGASTVGSTWTLNVGTWTGTPAPTYVQAWLRCSSPVTAVFSNVPAGCVSISGASGTTYVATAADAGRYLTAQVAGINPMGFALSGAVSTTSIESAAPANTAPPTVSGAAPVGSTWTLNVGTWTGTPAPTYVQAWLRCTSPVTTVFTTVPAGCAAISGANATTYVSTAADAGKYLTAQVGGINPSGFALSGAVNTTAVQAAATTAPVNTAPPTVSGVAAVGSTWTLSTGTWSGSPAPTFVQAWLRCGQPVTSVFTNVPPGCVAISGANGTTYVATAADAGKYITAQVAGINASGYALSGAVSTTAVQSAATPVNTAPPTVSGTAAVGATWTVNVGTWTGTPAPSYVQAWLRCTSPVTTTFTTVPAGCTAISGASATTYVATAADAGKYLTAQVAGINPSGFSLSGAVSTTAIP